MVEVDELGPSDGASGKERMEPGSAYFLAVLLIVGVLCYIDRSIISALAESLKHDMGLTDAQLGFLYGTSFSVLFAIFGFPLGRLSDVLPRTRLMAIGLAFWSLMTMTAGAASGFATLAATRLGLGLGESTANPCSHSLIVQKFPSRLRARALSVYLLGTSVGSGLGLLIGGWMVENWSAVCGSLPIEGACGIASWRAALVLVGLPGLILALVVARLPEPPRTGDLPKNVGRLVLHEFSATLPPLTLFALHAEGGLRAVGANLLLAFVLAASAAGLVALTGDTLQWIGLGIGLYALGSWSAVMKLRDRPLFMLTFGCPTFLFSLIGFVGLACMHLGISFWAVPYAIRVLEIPPARVGLFMGGIVALAAAGSALFGGVLTDWWRKRDIRAPLWIGVLALVLSAPFVVIMFTTTNHTVFLVSFLAQAVLGGCFAPGAAVLAQELVLLRMRGTAAACFALTILLVSLAFGPYMMGKISALTGSLSTGILSSFVFAPIAVVFFLLAARRLVHETPDGRLARARAHGEPHTAGGGNNVSTMAHAERRGLESNLPLNRGQRA